MSHLNFDIFRQFEFFGIFNELLSSQNANVARLAHNETFSVIFKNRVKH